MENDVTDTCFQRFLNHSRTFTAVVEQLSQHLPSNFVWPTTLQIDSQSAYMEWGRLSTDTEDKWEESVWIVIRDRAVHMNANFRPDWPECGAAEFDAQLAAEWLLELTKNWNWSVDVDSGGDRSGVMLGRRSMKDAVRRVDGAVVTEPVAAV